MLKKVIFFILTIICTVCTVGYFRYNPIVDTANKIPVSADIVVRVNLREIEYSMLKDVVKHPFSYFKSFKKKQHKKAFSLIDQVVLPATIFFYTNHHYLKNTWVSTAIEIKNQQQLLSFFNQEGFIKKSFSNVDYFRYKNLIYCVFKNELRLVFGLDEITNVETKLTAILNTNDYLSDEDSVVQKLKNSKQLIAMSTKNDDFLELGIDENIMSITGNLAEKNMPFLSYKKHRYNNNNNNLGAVSGRIKKSFLFNYLNEKQKNSFEKLTNLSLDSIHTYWNGEFDAHLASFIHQKDTIISYEYDDDFNKIAKTTIQKTIIPDLNIRLGGSALFEYLSSEKSIKNINGENILVVNPFFKTYASNSKNELFLFSKERINNVFNSVNQDENNKFSLFFDVEKHLKTQENIFFIHKNYLAEIKNIQALITKNNKVNFNIFFKKTPQNLIYQAIN